MDILIIWIILAIIVILIKFIMKLRKENKYTFENNVKKVEVLDSSIDNEVKRFVEAGEKIQAIKRYREITGVGLKEAKDYIDYLCKNGVAKASVANDSIYRTDTDLSEDSEIKRLVASGEKIKAIKRYREITGCGLKEAKDYIESKYS